jgi:hypothetical protein
MKSNRTHAEIDGTLILEEWGAHVLKNYLGPVRAKSFVFGTSSQGRSFEERVNHLHAQTKEGGPFQNIDDIPTDANDGKLDVVAWIPFGDSLSGQVSVFAQCKTGTHWRDKMSELQPSSFITKWMGGSFIVLPLRVFMVSEAINRGKWKSTGVDAGILFDRCRIIDCIGEAESGLLDRTKRWVEAAKRSLSVPTAAITTQP